MSGGFSGPTAGPDGRSALVTGASRGIGRAIALRLAARGYRLTVVARNREGLEAVTAELRDAGAPEVLAAPADMTDPDAVAGAVDAHGRRFGSMNAMVLNAGMGDRGRIADYPARRFERIFAVNVRAPFTMLQAATPLLRAAAEADPARGAAVLALASSTGVHTEPGYGAYGSSKAALISLIEAYALEESASGVSATTLSPGYVDTDMTDWLPADMAGTLLAADDIAALAETILTLGRNAVVANVTVTRSGSNGHQA